VLTEFIVCVLPSPFPVDVKKIVGLKDTATVAMYFIFHLTPPVLVCKSSGKRGVLDLYISSAFPYHNAPGVRAGLIERFDHSRGRNHLTTLSGDNEPVLQKVSPCYVTPVQSTKFCHGLNANLKRKGCFCFGDGGCGRGVC